MNYLKPVFFLLFIIIISLSEVKAQIWSVGIYINGINVHLKKPVNPDLYHRAISKNKRLVYNIGGGLRIAYYLNHYAGITITQVLVPQDCGNKFFGLTHAGIFLTTKYFNQSKHEVLLIGGPILFYRKNWNSLPGYKDDQLMAQTKNKIWQYKFVWHGGFLEYQYQYNKSNTAGIHVMPGIPELLSISAQHTSFIK